MNINPSLLFFVFFLFSVTMLSAVIATMRDLKRKDNLVKAAGDLYGKTLFVAELDVCSDESVKQCVDSIKDRHIDILSEYNESITILWNAKMSKPGVDHSLFFNSSFFSKPVSNAGIGLVGPVESIPMDEMNNVFETNFYGSVRLIKEVMPDMKNRRAGRIIVISSVMGLQGEQT